MGVSQTSFRAGLLDPECPPPEGLFGPGDTGAGKRYAVYRNNVTVSLVEAMKEAFPTVRALLGAQNFDTLMPLYVRAHPPKTPLMMHYGTDFPAFLEGFAPLSHLGYLSDVARLDLAMRRAYHAADAAPFDATVLQQPPEVLATLPITVSPATQVIRSRWPLYDLYQRARTADAPKPRAIAQSVVITRPGYDPEVHLPPAGTAIWLDALREKSLGDAVEYTQAECADFDFAQSLKFALQAQAFTQ